VADARAKRVRDRIAYRGGGRAVHHLAQSERRRIRRVDQLDLDRRHLREAQDRIIVPGDRGDAAVREPHRLLDGPARRLDGAALDLIARAVRPDDQPAVDRAPDLFDPHGLLDLHLGDDGGITRLVLVTRETQAARAAAAAFAAARPAAHPRGGLD